MTNEMRLALIRNLSEMTREQIAAEAVLAQARARVQQAIRQIQQCDDDRAEDNLSETLYAAMTLRKRRIEGRR